MADAGSTADAVAAALCDGVCNADCSCDVVSEVPVVLKISLPVVECRFALDVVVLMLALDDGARDSAVGRWGAGKAGTEDEIPGIVMPGMQPRKNSNAKRSNRSSGSSQRNHAGKSNHQRLLACL